MKSKPVCAEIIPWLSSNLGARSLAGLTGTDTKALYAAVHIIELYSYDGDPSVVEAFAKVVLRMQPSSWSFAYHSVAMIMNWSDRARLWAEAGLPDINAGKCKYEA